MTENNDNMTVSMADLFECWKEHQKEMGHPIESNKMTSEQSKEFFRIFPREFG